MKGIFVLYSIASILSMMAIGVAVGMRSGIGIVASIALLMIVMGYGFKTKKKMREKGLL